MKLYVFERSQTLPISLQQAWEFFSAPDNLSKITPPYMGFIVIWKDPGQRMYPGMIISYIVKPLLNMPMRWVTEITHVQEPHYFVDEQRFGPYSFWHHKHFFKEVEGGTEMRDLVHYGLPMGRLGGVANSLMVRKKLEDIFAYRYTVLEQMFGTL